MEPRSSSAFHFPAGVAGKTCNADSLTVSEHPNEPEPKETEQRMLDEITPPLGHRHAGPDLPPQLPIRRERKQPRLRTALRESHLFHRQVDSVRLLSCSSIIASVFF